MIKSAALCGAADFRLPKAKKVPHQKVRDFFQP